MKYYCKKKNVSNVFPNNSFLFSFHITCTLAYPGGIELRESLIPANKKTDEELQCNNSPNVATKKEEKSNSEMKDAIIQDKNSPVEVIKKDVCPKKDEINNSEPCKDSNKTNGEDEKQDNVPKMTKSTSSNLNCKENSTEDVCQQNSISNKTNQHLPIVSDDKKQPKIVEHECTKKSSNNVSQTENTTPTTKVNATTETPPAQLVVTFSNDTIGGNHPLDFRTHSKLPQHKYECNHVNHVIEDNNDSIDDRKNSCEGSYSCSCDDSCFNGGSIVSQEKYTSNFDSGKTSPTCLHSNSNITSIQLAPAAIANMIDSSSLQNGGNKKKKVAVATQTASISASLCSSAGSPGSSDDQPSLKSTNHERTLSSVIGDYNRRLSGSSNNFNSSSKYRLAEEPLSLMQEVPDVSL